MFNAGTRNVTFPLKVHTMFTAIKFRTRPSLDVVDDPIYGTHRTYPGRAKNVLFEDPSLLARPLDVGEVYVVLHGDTPAMQHV